MSLKYKKISVHPFTIPRATNDYWSFFAADVLPFWKSSFPMNPYVRLLVGLSGGWIVSMSACHKL